MFSESEIIIKMKASLLMLCMIITYTQALYTKHRSYFGDQAIATGEGNTYITPKKVDVKKENEEEALSRAAKECDDERKASALAGKPYTTTTNELGENGLYKISELLDSILKYITISANIEKPKTTFNNKSTNINRKRRVIEENEEEALSKALKEFEDEKKASALAGNPYKITTYELGENGAKKISEVLDSSLNYSTMGTTIEKPKTTFNNKSIEINQKNGEVEENEEQALSRALREFKDEREASALAGNPYKTTTYELGENGPKKISEVLDPNLKYGTMSTTIEKQKTTFNNKSTKRNRNVANKNNVGRRRRNVKPNGRM